MRKRSSVASLGWFVLGCSWIAACGSEDSDTSATTVFTTTAPLEGGDDASTDRCLGDVFEDDFVARRDDATALGGHIEALASSDAGVVACGEGFVEVVGVGSLDLAGTCTSLAAAGTTAIVGTREGSVSVVDLAGPTIVGSLQLGDRVHGVAYDGSNAWAAAGSDGVVAIGVASGGPTNDGALGAFADARGVAHGPEGLWVAAGTQGIALIDAATGASLGTAMTDFESLGVRATDDGAIVLLGVNGWERYAAGGGGIAREDGDATTGAVLDATMHAGDLVTAEVHTLVRRSGGARRFEERASFDELVAPWYRAVVSHDGELLAAAGDEIIPVDVRASSDAPDLMVDATTVYMWGDAGEPLESLVVIENAGDEPLVLGEVEADAMLDVSFQDGDPVDGCPDAVAVAPGGSVLLSVKTTPDSTALATGEIRISSNDPDEPELRLSVDVNRGEPELGSDAVDFELLTIYGERVRLSDHAGKVVLVKMFNFGCKRCAEEFAEVQADIVGSYAASEFVAIGVNTTHRTAFAGKIVDEGDLTLPVTLDLDSMAFRHFRMPEKVFPLNVVVGRDGKILHVDAEEGLASASAAIADAM